MRWVNAAIIVFLLLYLVYSHRGCKDEIKTPINTMQVDKYKAQIDSLKTEYLTLLNNRAVKIKTLRTIRTKYVHDTLTVENLVNDTSGIANLLSENALMREIILDDSLVISNQGQTINLQDSVISHLEAITATQKDFMDGCITEVKKQRKKASFWKTVAIALGIVAIAK